MAWLPPLALHRIILVAAHTGLSPWTPVVPFVADGTPQQGGDVVSVATQTILGYGVLGVLAPALAWIVWKGSFVPQKRVDELIASGRADLFRENERLLADVARVQAELAGVQDQRDAALRFGSDQVVPLLFEFTGATKNLSPILLDLTRGRDEDAPPRRRGRELP